MDVDVEDHRLASVLAGTVLAKRIIKRNFSNMNEKLKGKKQLSISKVRQFAPLRIYQQNEQPDGPLLLPKQQEIVLFSCLQKQIFFLGLFYNLLHLQEHFLYHQA